MDGMNRFVWNELMTGDVEAAKRFYAGLLGREYDRFPIGEDGDYWIIKGGEHGLGGIMQAPPGAPTMWVAYVAVDDVDRVVADAVRKGARVMKPAFDVPKVGRLGFLTDPTGAMIALITPEPAET
jgi:predicted enzyme related to lactoylglutathione lyase